MNFVRSVKKKGSKTNGTAGHSLCRIGFVHRVVGFMLVTCHCPLNWFAICKVLEIAEGTVMPTFSAPPPMIARHAIGSGGQRDRRRFQRKDRFE